MTIDRHSEAHKDIDDKLKALEIKRTLGTYKAACFLRDLGYNCYTVRHLLATRG